MSRIVISGGSACNAVVEAFSTLPCSFVLPISDDGGSSSEILRVFGGSSVGDIRSRLIRLIPEVKEGSPLAAIKTLLEYRLSDTLSSSQVRSEWLSIVEGSHRTLWKGIPIDRKECIRAFLIHFETAVMKKAQRGFSFKRASVGNLFLSGATMYLGSLASAIFLFASITEIPHSRSRVLPVINTTSIATIAAELENGEIIIGQSEISHPSPSPSLHSPSTSTPISSHPPSTSTSQSLTPFAQHLRKSPHISSPLHATFTPLSLTRPSTPSLFQGPIMGDEEPAQRRRSSSAAAFNSSGTGLGGEGGEGEGEGEFQEILNDHVSFNKETTIELSSRINRIFYLNAYGQETLPRCNPLFIEELSNATSLIYSPGSLYTSIIPCIALSLVGSSISNSKSLKYKILLLNSRNDRETPNYTAEDFVRAIVKALNSTEEEEDKREIGDYLTHLVYLEESEIQVDRLKLEALGIVCIGVKGKKDFDTESVKSALELIEKE